VLAVTSNLTLVAMLLMLSKLQCMLNFVARQSWMSQ
jgi:hypothetical protein